MEAVLFQRCLKRSHAAPHITTPGVFFTSLWEEHIQLFLLSIRQIAGDLWVAGLLKSHLVTLYVTVPLLQCIYTLNYSVTECRVPKCNPVLHVFFFCNELLVQKSSFSVRGSRCEQSTEVRGFLLQMYQLWQSVVVSTPQVQSVVHNQSTQHPVIFNVNRVQSITLWYTVSFTHPERKLKTYCCPYQIMWLWGNMSF